VVVERLASDGDPFLQHELGLALGEGVTFEGRAVVSQTDLMPLPQFGDHLGREGTQGAEQGHALFDLNEKGIHGNGLSSQR